MTNYEKIWNICDDNNGVIQTEEADRQGIPRWFLSDMVKRGDLIRVVRGIYTTRDGDYDDYYFFQKRNTRCIYSFESALFLHGMTERIPFQKEVTVYKGYNGSHINDARVHYVSRAVYELGVIESATTFGNKVRTYDKERTICDLISKRDKIDVEIFSNAIKAYFADEDRDYKKLREYSRALKVTSKVDDILEVISDLCFERERA